MRIISLRVEEVVGCKLKLISTILILLFFGPIIFAQDIRILVKTTDSKFWGYSDENGNVTFTKYLYCEPFSEDGFAVVCEWAIKPQFAGARDFKNGYAAVSIYAGEQELWGIIDTSGKFLIEPKFKNAKDVVILK